MSAIRCSCAFALLLLGTGLLSGCSNTEGKMSKEEGAQFKGGTPSPEQAAEMGKFFAREAEKNKAKATSNVPHPQPSTH